MAQDKIDNSGKKNQEYQPKATVRHAKIARSRMDDIENSKKKIASNKYHAKNYESKRRKEIKELPKDERAAAKAELKESIVKRKEAEKKDKAMLREMIDAERDEKRAFGDEAKEEKAKAREIRNKDRMEELEPDLSEEENPLGIPEAKVAEQTVEELKR